MNLSNGKGSMSSSTSGTAWKSGDVVPDQFPAGLRVLVVDDDPTCLMILEKMLRTCLYEGKAFSFLLSENFCFFVFVLFDSFNSFFFSFISFHVEFYYF